MRFAPRARALLAVLLCCTGIVSAQQPVLLLAPQAGAVDVTVKPDIIVLAPAPIDQASITTRWPNSELNGWRSDEPTLLLLRADDAARYPRSAWSKHAVRVRYAQIDPRMLRMTAGTLAPGTQYVGILQRMTVDGGAQLPPLEFAFTTRHDVPRLYRTSLEGIDVLRCTDNITMSFTAPLSTLPSAPSAYISVTSSGRDVPHIMTVDEKGQRVTLAPKGHWPAGATLRVDVRMGRATGEELDNKRFDVPIRGAGRVKVEPKEIRGHAIDPSVRSTVSANAIVAVVDGTYEVQCPPWPTPTWRFLRWESADVPAIHGSTDPVARWKADCAILDREIAIDAIVERVDTVKVPVQIDNGMIEVYDDEGALLEIYDADDTLYLTAAAPSITLHAVAAAGTTFGSWSAQGISINGSTAAAVPLSMSAMNPSVGHGMVSKPVIPRFVTPTGSERYRLRGQLQDIAPEEGFDVQQSATWTTAQEYELSEPVTRQLCIAARDCWEVLGYMSINGRTMFDKPQREACVEAQLLDPEHVVTFFVRRIPLQLRVELALLESDGSDDLIYDRHPHPDVRVSADLGKTVGNTTVWQPLGETTCRTLRELARATWKVSCGDQVRLRIRDAASRGETWQYFAARTNYALPAGGRRVDDTWEYTLVAGTDLAHFDAESCDGKLLGRKEIRVQACFRAELGIDALAVRMRVGGSTKRFEARFEERWLDPLVYYDRLSDEPVGGRQLEYIPRKGTEIKVRFTRPIDITSVEQGSLILESFGNIDPLNVGRTNMDFIALSSDKGNMRYEPFNGGPINTVVMHAYDPNTTPRLHATYFGSLDLTATQNIRSLRGARLRSTGSFALNTMELPGYGVQLRSIGLDDDGDWDVWPIVLNGEIYHAMYGGVLAANAAMHIDMGFRRLPPCSVQQGTIPDDCTYDQGDTDPPMQFGDLLQYIEPSWLDRTDMAFSHIQTYDEDCKDKKGCLVGEMQNIIVRLRDQLSGSASDSAGSTPWSGIVPGLIRSGFDLINALMDPDDQDEYLGEHTMLEGVSGLWGVNASGIRTGRGRHTTYTYRPRFFPRAAVAY